MLQLASWSVLFLSSNPISAFLRYINDIHLAMEFSTIYHFADDTNLLYSCNTLKVLRKNINADLQKLYDWLCTNRLSLNSGKSEFLVFRHPRHKTYERFTLKLHHSKLFESQKIKYLCLILVNKLDWKDHIAELTKNLSRAIGLIHKMVFARYRYFVLCITVSSILIYHTVLLSGVMLVAGILKKLDPSKKEF